jgi:glycosyltransferase involved in cell wall biosynthesis
MLIYEYLFLELDNNKYGNIHPATKKIHILNDFLQSTNYDIIIFLDSDAWIQNGYWLNQLIHTLINNNDKHGCFSRDPYTKQNTFINSGSFIIKNDDFIKQMYTELIAEMYRDERHNNKWPYDQFYISNYVFKYKKHFIVFIPDILNTPNGKVLRHNWLKNKKMYDDLNELNSLTVDCFDKTIIDESQYYDEGMYPNT